MIQEVVVNKKQQQAIYLLVWLLVAVFLSGCTGRQASTDKESSEKQLKELRIAYQYGTAYAPVELAKAQGQMAKALPGVKLEWLPMGNTAAIREAMAAGQVDIGFMAIPPFLIGYDKGMEWQIFTGLSSVPAALLSKREDIQGIEDFKEGDKIALPQPGSIQHILLSMACKERFGDAHKMDGMLLTLSHPDAMSLMLSSEELAGHFTTPPYLEQEMEQAGMKVVLDGEQAFGQPYTFIVGVASKDFYTKYPEQLQKVGAVLEESMKTIENNKDQIADELSQIYQVPAQEIAKTLHLPGMRYSKEVDGLETFTTFMKEEGYISESYSRKELIVE